MEIFYFSSGKNFQMKCFKIKINKLIMIWTKFSCCISIYKWPYYIFQIVLSYPIKFDKFAQEKKTLNVHSKIAFTESTITFIPNF